MKKFMKILTCLAMCFSFTGCFSKVYNRTTTNSLTTNGLGTVSDINSLITNVESMMKKVNGVSGTYTLTNTKETYVINFNIITKNQRVNWDLSADTKIDGKDVDIYTKDKKMYIIYPHNGANIILKDDIKNIIVEAKDTLNRLDATYDRENFDKLAMGDKLEGFNFQALKDEASYVANSNGTYTLTFVEDELTWEYEITSDYLISELRCEAINFNSVLKISYPKELTINYPKGLDFLTLDIEDAKSVLEVDSFAEIIDEDLKEKK